MAEWRHARELTELDEFGLIVIASYFLARRG
jgi:hypothetical protein